MIIWIALNIAEMVFEFKFPKGCDLFLNSMIFFECIIEFGSIALATIMILYQKYVVRDPKFWPNGDPKK